MTTIPAYTIGGLTRPELQLDSTGHIILDSAAQAFVDTYGLQYLYLGCPPGTPWPPVSDSLSTPVDANSGNNTVSEGAAANTLVNITAQAISSSGNPVTYSLTGDTSHGGFKIDPNTGVVSVADPTKVNYVTSPGHAYTITVQASDGIATSSQSFVIGVTDVAPSTPVDSNAAANKVAEGSAAGTLVGITASATDMNAVTYTLTGDTSGGGFKIDPNTGVITVADPSKIDYTTAPGHAYTVTATASDGTLSSSQTFSIAVTLGAATHFTVSIPANGAAGTPGTVTVTALDSLNHVVTNYTGTVHFTSSDGHAVLPTDVTLTNGTGSFSETLDTAGSQTITATDTVDHTVTGTSNAEIVTPGVATHFSVSLPANGTAGTPGSVTVTALDAFGNVATGYTGSVHFTSTDGIAVLPADTTLTNGVGTFSETLDTAGNQTITATDTVAAAITGTSNAETVKGGAATHLVVSIPANGAAGTPGTVTVTALDAFGNVASGYTGTVHFTSTDGHAVLPANMTLTNGVGSFSETFGTVGSQTITATDTVSAAITGTSNAETVAPGPATHFVVTLPAGGTAGVAGSATITAYDAFGNIASGYAGTVHFTSTDGHAGLPADMTLTNGTATFSETLDTAGSQTITATDTVSSAITGTSNAETVTAAAVAHFAVAIPANGTAGMPGMGTVTALDAFGNVVTGYTGTVHFTSTDASAVLPADMTLTNGVGSFSETFKTAGSQTVIATDTLHGAVTGTSNAETVAGAAATLLVVSIPGNGAAGTPGTVTVTALDAFGNVATGYTGTVHFTSSDGHAVLPANMTLTNGTGSFSETFETAGSQTITATDTVSAGISGTSNAETVAPGPATHFVVTLQTPGTAGVAGSATITALDAFGNIATGYTGTVHFTSSDGQAVLPANMTLTNGTATFSETLDTAGSQTITATDTVNSAITGTSNTETVTAAAATHFAVAIPANGTAGTAGSGTVTALDAFGNVVTGYTGTVHFTSSDAGASLPADMTLTNGTGTFSETFDTAGSQIITATDTVAAAITGTSNAETVAPGAATHFVVTIPANGRADIPGTVTVTALDAHNNVATGYSGTVHFTSSDGSAVLPADMTLTNGTGTFNETFGTAGTQTITATDTANAGITGTSNSETVAPPDAPPVVTAGHTLNYIEAQPATAFDPALTVTDSDSANLAHATVQITGNYVAGEDVLAFSTIGAITGSFDAVHGILTLTGSDTVAHYQAALDAVTYVNTSNNPSGLARTVTIIANDGILDSTPVTDTIDVTPVNNPPVVTFGAITNFSEPPVGTPPANSVPVTIAPNLTITDVDSTNLISATFVLNDLKPSDALSIAGHAGTSGDIGNIHFDISSTATTETVTLTGTDTIAHYNSVLDLVQFNNTGEPPDTTARSYTVTAQDDGGTANGGNDTGSASASQTVTAIDDPPTATVPSASSVGTAFSHTNLAISGLSVADIDSAGGNETATITSNHGALIFDTTGLASFTNNGSHTVTLTGTIAQLNTALATLNYNSDDGFTGSDFVTLSINDNSHTGTGGPLSSSPQGFQVGVVPQVFYIDNSATSSHNLGTQADPYTSIAAFNAANPAGSGDYVVLEHGTGTYSEANGISLANGVNLIGGSHTLQFTNPVTGVTVTANVGSGADPVIQVTGAHNGIDLLGTSGHTITGVSIDTSASTGIGISDDGNNVGTVAMSDIAVKTASGAGMSFTHGGTITVTGSSNTITSTTGTALDVENTQIGSSNLTFKSITSSGGSNDGIILSNTGTAAGNGGLHVTGDGSTAGSGGTIASKTGADGSTTQGSGIFLNNTKDVQISYLAMHDFQNYGIVGTNVTGFTLGNTTVTGTNGDNVGGIGEGDVYFTGLSGTASVTNSTFTGAALDAFHVFNNSGQTLNRITITGSTFATNTAAANQSGDALVFQATDGTFNATIQSSTFTSARGDLFQLDLHGGVSSDLVLGGASAGLGNSFSNNNQNIVSGGGGITVSSGGTGDHANLTFNIAHNTMRDAVGTALGISTGSGASSFTGTIDSNTIGVAGVTNSGSSQGSDIGFITDGGANSSVTITNNHLYQYNNDGIQVQTGDAVDGGNARLTAIVMGNTVSNPGTFGNHGFELNAGTVTGDAQSVSLTMGGTGAQENQFLGSGANGGTDIRLRDRFDTTVGLHAGDGTSYSGSSTDTAAISAYVLAHNTVTTAPTFSVTAGSVNGFGASPMLAADGGVQAAVATPGETHLTQSELNSVVSAAIAQWVKAGVDSDQLAALHAVTFSVADLAGQIVGLESAGHITIDTDAAGHGWFVDPTPSDNFEFTHALNASGSSLQTDPSTAAAGHLDLLTAVVHELGHVLGLPDLTSASDANDLMYIDLADGERRLPTATDVAQANVGSVKAMPTQSDSSSNLQATNSLSNSGGFDFSSFTQTPSQTNTSHLDLTANSQTLSDLFGGHSNAAPWWLGHETTFVAMGGTPTDNHLQTHHDLVV
ncbi:hypothetical protein QMZ05_24805 [Bradyrhizobium sp. INPA03-11B]|uniref:hypothetical protein n=1 Tax=Bradyrhizobium sp. INPA03-11B TaxID=418598 RepID=UPI0033902E28